MTSSNPQLLEQTAQQIMSEIRALPSAGSVTSDRSLPRQELTVTPNRLAMADKGVTTQDIATTLRVATVGDYEQRLSKLNPDTRQILLQDSSAGCCQAKRQAIRRLIRTELFTSRTGRAGG